MCSITPDGSGVADGVQTVGAAVESLVRACGDGELDGFDGPGPRELMGLARELEVVLRRLGAVAVQMAGAIDRAGAYRADGHLHATAAVKHLGRLDGPSAATRVKGAAVLARLPEVAEAFAQGRIPVGHLRVLGLVGANPRVAEFFDDADTWFAEQACTLDHAAFEAVVRQWENLADAEGADRASERAHRRRDFRVDQHYSGDFGVRGRCDATQGTGIAAVLDAFERAEFEADWAAARAEHGEAATKADLARTPAQRRADAAYRIFQTAGTSPGTGITPPVVNVVIDETTYATELARRAAADADRKPGHDPNRLATDTLACHTSSGHRLTPGEAAMLAMVGLVRRAVIDDTANIINYGRTKRLFTGSARAAVLLRQALTDPAGTRCCWAGCDARGPCLQIDHDQPAADGGPTDHANGQGMCGGHNRLKQTGFTPHRQPDGTYRIHRPDGTPITRPA